MPAIRPTNRWTYRRLTNCKLMMERMIDTHIHVWDLGQAKYSWLEGDTSILNRNYALEELETERSKAGVTEGVLVQAASN